MTRRRAWCMPSEEVRAGRALLDDEYARTVSLGAAPGSPPFGPVEHTASDLWAPLNAANEEASSAPENCTPEVCASVASTALAGAKGPINSRGMTPVTVASACSRQAGPDPCTFASCSIRFLGLRW